MTTYVCPDKCNVTKKFMDCLEYPELSDVPIGKQLIMMEMTLCGDETWKPKNYIAISGLIETNPPILQYFVEDDDKPIEMPDDGFINLRKPYVNMAYKRMYYDEDPQNYSQNLIKSLITTDASVVKGSYVYHSSTDEYLPDALVRMCDFIQHTDVESEGRYGFINIGKNQFRVPKISISNGTCSYQAGFFSSKLRNKYHNEML